MRRQSRWNRLDCFRGVERTDGALRSKLQDGAPASPAFVFVTDAATLAETGAGGMSAVTTLAQARSTDPAPMTIEFVNGFSGSEDSREQMFSVIMHFFNAGDPEVTCFNLAHARVVHGAFAVPLHYGD